MTDVIDADDLALLASGFQAALTNDDPAAAEAAMFELGWGEVLAASPWQAMATAFPALGATTSSAAIVDDVLIHALGLEVSPTTCIVLPAPHRSTPPARRQEDRVEVDGIASGRVGRATTAVIAVPSEHGVELVTVDAAEVQEPGGIALDPSSPYHRVRVDLEVARLTVVGRSPRWSDAVAAGRTALAHELVAGARTMLGHAREHAVEREQFGRTVSSFQAVRHKLAEALVRIEAADAAVDVCGPDVDALVPALAKSLAGKAARTTGAHAQQVLAGIGFTTEHPFQRWMKRSLVLDLLLGSSSSLPLEIGAELVRRGGAPRLIEL